MPPRYAYWTILIDNQPTAFRAGLLEDLMPTFNRLKDKHPKAELKWFQNGRLWATRFEAREAMRERGDRGKARDMRQQHGRQQPERQQPERPARAKLEWKPREAPRAKLEWKPRESPRAKLEWKPREAPREGAKRAKDWRPGGDHRDPRQKYKDAKKARWTRFKQTIRARHDRRKKREDE